MKVVLIRHGKTVGNLQKRYIGTTDEPLCEEGIRELKDKKVLYDYKPDHIFVSPMVRCRETASILFPDSDQVIVPDFRECDFGAFENKNYLELSGNADYQRWIDSNGTLPFPGGESQDTFKSRCIAAYQKLMTDYSFKEEDVIVLVVHGGTIMSIMEYLNTDPSRSYYDFQIKNGECFIV